MKTITLFELAGSVNPVAIARPALSLVVPDAPHLYVDVVAREAERRGAIIARACVDALPGRFADIQMIVDREAAAIARAIAQKLSVDEGAVVEHDATDFVSGDIVGAWRAEVDRLCSASSAPVLAQFGIETESPPVRPTLNDHADAAKADAWKRLQARGKESEGARRRIESAFGPKTMHPESRALQLVAALRASNVVHLGTSHINFRRGGGGRRLSEVICELPDLASMQWLSTSLVCLASCLQARWPRQGSDSPNATLRAVQNLRDVDDVY